MTIAYSDVGGRGNYLPEPSIRNIEIWLNWQACQLDMPHWWVEPTSIPNVENPKRLTWKICTSFLIPAVRCETFPGQAYTMPPALKCLTRNMFLPWWSILLGCSTAAFAADCGLSPSTAVLDGEIYTTSPPRLLPFGNEHHGTNACCEGACCLLQLRHPPGPMKNCSRNCRLGSSGPQRVPYHPINHNWHQRYGVNLCWSPGAHGATPLLFGPPPEETPPVEPIALPTVDDVGHTLSGPFRPSAGGKCYSSFNWTQNKGLANWSRC